MFGSRRIILHMRCVRLYIDVLLLCPGGLCSGTSSVSLINFCSHKLHLGGGIHAVDHDPPNRVRDAFPVHIFTLHIR